MSEKRFLVETVEITDCCTDESRIAEVITDKEECYSYDDLYELADDMNEMVRTNKKLQLRNNRQRGQIFEMKAEIIHLQEQLENKADLIRNLERKVTSQKRVLRKLNNE